MAKISTIILLALHLANVVCATESPIVRRYIILEDSFDFPEANQTKTVVRGCSPFIVLDDPEPEETEIIEVPLLVGTGQDIAAGSLKPKESQGFEVIHPSWEEDTEGQSHFGRAAHKIQMSEEVGVIEWKPLSLSEEEVEAIKWKPIIRLLPVESGKVLQ